MDAFGNCNGLRRLAITIYFASDVCSIGRVAFGHGVCDAVLMPSEGECMLVIERLKQLRATKAHSYECGLIQWHMHI